MRIKSAAAHLPQQLRIQNKFEIMLPEIIAKKMDELELIKTIYPDIQTNAYNIEFMSNRAILAAKNTDVDKINELASNYFPGESREYLSADSVRCIKQQNI